MRLLRACRGNEYGRVARGPVTASCKRYFAVRNHTARSNTRENECQGLADSVTDSRCMELDFFVMLSSLNGVVGTRGRANYAAGNTYQDALAHYRTDSQTAYISLGLGMIEDSSAYYN